MRTDYRTWFAEAEAYVRVRRGDVLIEGAPGSVEEFRASALPVAIGSYPVELVVLAVREADSRLATALRDARALQIGGNGRFTSRAGHDRCFRALADVVELAQTHRRITVVTVIRRDGEPCSPRGRRPGAISWALAAERMRPYTEQEAAQFLTLHQALPWRRATPP
ncbi:zeta toxin family protein [Streptomyces sp. NPDC002926]